MTDFVAFERLCCTLLSTRGSYEAIVPQGVGRIDGGRDAILVVRDPRSVTTILKRVIFHFSLRKKLKDKLYEDLASVRRRRYEANLIVFVTSQKCTPQLRAKLQRKCLDEFGWDLEIFDQDWLGILLDGEFVRLRKDYIGIDYDHQVFAPIDVLLESPKRHPTRDDLEVGAYYRNDELFSQIRLTLKDHQACLLTGSPGSGKTALARALGYELQKEDCRQIVFYLSARRDAAYEKWMQHIKSMDHSYVLFVIDDCHLAIEQANELVARLSDIKRARVLLVSRAIASSLSGPIEESFIDALADRSVNLKSDQATIEAIISAIVIRSNVASRRRGPIEPVLKRCEGDLHLLEFLVSAWLKDDDLTRPLAEVSDELILDGVYRRYVERSRHQKEICRIAALSQFEIPFESSRLGERATIFDMLSDAFVESDVISPQGAPVEMLQYFHSTPAQYVVRAAHSRGMLHSKSADEFVFIETLRYLASDPANFLDVFRQLGRAQRGDLRSRLLREPDVLAAAERLIKTLPSLPSDGLMFSLFQFLTVLWREESRARNGSARQLLDLYLNVHPPEANRPAVGDWGLPTVALFLGLLKIDTDIEKRVLKIVDSSLLARLANRATPGGLRKFLAEASGIDRELLDGSFLKQLDFGSLGGQSNRSSASQIGRLVSLLRQYPVAGSDLALYFAELDFIALGKRTREIGFRPLSAFLNSAKQCTVDYNRLVEFCSQLDFAAIAGRAKTAGIMSTLRFMILLRDVGASAALQQFSGKLGVPRLERQAEQGGIISWATFEELFGPVEGILYDEY